VERDPRNAARDLRIEGPTGSGTICIDGAAAHLNEPGDLVILATFAEVDDAEARERRAG
jgi:aspartate 1-decarboxylase